jgi:predicted NodU family carbamoyl transferase
MTCPDDCNIGFATVLGELQKIDPEFDAIRLMFTVHHYAHAASAFFPFLRQGLLE